MGIKFGGFVCNGCAVFQQYKGTRNFDEWMEYLIPTKWQIMSNHKINNGWVRTNPKEKDIVIYCGNCSRSLKINRIRHGIQQKNSKIQC